MDLAASALPGIVIPSKEAPAGAGFTISIPASHPKADKLVKLFQFLETRVVMPSGIEIKRPSPLSDPVTEFLGMLREVVDDKPSFDRALSQLADKQKKNSLGAMGLAMQNPQVLAALLEAPLAQGFMGDRVEHQENKKWALNMANKLRDRS